MPTIASRQPNAHRLQRIAVAAILLVATVVLAQTDPAPVPPPPDDADQITVLRESLADLQQRNAELQQRLDDADAGSGEQAEELRAMRDEIARQQVQLTHQLDELEAHGQTSAEQADRIAALEDMVLSLNNRMLEMQDLLPDSTLTAAMQQRLDQLESSVEELPELPAEVVGAGEFPGSFRIPGTDAMLKIGGLVKTSLVYNLDALATDDRFFTAGIPIAGTVEAGKGSRLTLSARSSRFNLDLRTPTGVGHVRAFIEGDFAGADNTFRLRHAFGQYNKYIFGQTWSTAVDLEAVPEEIDFEGLNAKILPRKAQIRGTFKLGDKDLRLGIEDPAPDLTGASGISLVPDMVAGIHWPLGDGHLRTTAIFRVLRGENDANPNQTYRQMAWGASVSGRLALPAINDQDNVRFGIHFGEGYGRYVNDLGAEGGQDAVFDPIQDELRTLPVFAGYVSLAHWWKAQSWRSTACFGYVHVENLDIQTDDSYRETMRFSLNVIYTPAPRMDVGIEVLTGRRTNKDRQYGTATQVQLAWYFRF